MTYNGLVRRLNCRISTSQLELVPDTSPIVVSHSPPRRAYSTRLINQFTQLNIPNIRHALQIPYHPQPRHLLSQHRNHLRDLLAKHAPLIRHQHQPSHALPGELGHQNPFHSAFKRYWGDLIRAQGVLHAIAPCENAGCW